MTMIMDEDENNGPTNGSMTNSAAISQQSMICSSSNLTTSPPSVPAATSDIRWTFSQVKGTLDDDVADGKCAKTLSSLLWLLAPLILADIISCVEFSTDGELLATGDKGGRVVIFQRDSTVSVSGVDTVANLLSSRLIAWKWSPLCLLQLLYHFSKSRSWVRLLEEFRNRRED